MIILYNVYIALFNNIKGGLASQAKTTIIFLWFNKPVDTIKLQ